MINTSGIVCSLSAGCVGTASPSYESKFIDNTGRISLLPITSRLLKLSKLNENWDGYGSLAPSELIIQNATSNICNFFSNTHKMGYQWIQPLISVSENGEITCEWWGVGSKKLTIYIGEDCCQFVKVWGLDIDDEMDEGTLNSLSFVFLWKWLYL